METEPQKPQFSLYFDDSGTRDLDADSQMRDDGMDWFGLGGVLIENENIPSFIESHRAFCGKWEVTSPLHSNKIRGSRKPFRFKKEKREGFLADLESLMVNAPVLCTACVIHRPGYLNRYRDHYQEKLWQLCKTAFVILIERSAKYVLANGGEMEIRFERTGPNEDGKLISYLRDLKTYGNPFSAGTSEKYQPLSAEEFSTAIKGEPRGKTKNDPLMQLADLVLYPICKSNYSQYRTFDSLWDAGKIIDCCTDVDDSMKIKFSCFDDL